MPSAAIAKNRAPSPRAVARVVAQVIPDSNTGAPSLIGAEPRCAREGTRVVGRGVARAYEADAEHRCMIHADDGGASP